MSDYRDRQANLARKVLAWIDQRPVYQRGSVVSALLAELPDAGKIWPRPVLLAAVARARQVKGTPDRPPLDGWVAALDDARVHDAKLPDFANPALRLLLGEPSERALALHGAVVARRSRPLRQAQRERRQRTAAQLELLERQHRDGDGMNALLALGLIDRAGRVLVDDDSPARGLRVTRGVAVGHWPRGAQTVYRADGTTTTLDAYRREQDRVRTRAGRRGGR